MTSLRIVGDVIELDGRPIARLLPELRLSLRDRLVELFDAIHEDVEAIAELEHRIEALEARKTPSGSNAHAPAVR